MRIDLNADLGEGSSADEALMEIVSSANIACGFHAGDANMMREAVKLAIKHGVKIGAHPSFPDRENFGRTAMNLPVETVYNQVLYQIGALDAIVRSEGGVMVHVKPHGMLYNQAAQDPALAMAIAKAVFCFNPNLKLMGLANGELIKAGEAIGLQTINEVFADRRYESNGALVSRTKEGAMIEETSESIQQTLNMIEHKTVVAIDGTTVNVNAQSVCLHGDGAHALKFATALKQTLVEKQISIQAV